MRLSRSGFPSLVRPQPAGQAEGRRSCAMCRRAARPRPSASRDARAGRPGPRRRPLRAGNGRNFSSRASAPCAACPIPISRSRCCRRSSAARSPQADVRAAGARGLCDLPPRRPSARWSRSAPNRLRAGALPWPDAGLQGRGHAAARPADGPRAGRARRSARRSSARPRATPAGRRSKPSPDATRTDIFILFPHGRVSPVQQRQMTTSAAANVHALAIEGNFDDCQAPGEGHVQRPCASATAWRCRASTRSTGRASWPRSSITSRRRCRSARRTGRSPLPCRPAISATFSPATPPSGWACRSSGW